MLNSTSKLLLEPNGEAGGLIITYPVELDLERSCAGGDMAPVSISLALSGLDYGRMNGKHVYISFACDEYDELIYKQKVTLDNRSPIHILWSGELPKKLGKVKIYNTMLDLDDNPMSHTEQAFVQFSAQI